MQDHTGDAQQEAAEAARWRVDALTAAEVPQMRELFQQVFGHALSEAAWHWKYADGHGGASAVWEADGRMVAHYAGFPRAARMYGKAVVAMQVGDVMVHPDARGTLSRKGPLYLSTTHFLERSVGYGKQAVLSYGFPNVRAMRVAERLGLYAACGKMVALTWAADSTKLPWWLAIEPVDVARPGWERRVDRIWAAMDRGFADSVICVRDGAWIKRRFVDKPEAQYSLHWLRHRLSPFPFALVVTKRTGEQLEWLDIVAAPNDWAYCRQAIGHLAAEQGLVGAFMWISAGFAPRLREGARETDLGIALPTSACTHGPTADELRDRWFLTGGDTDFL